MRLSYPASRPLSRSSHTNWNANDYWFCYTRGRFLPNEAREMAIRHVGFNMHELAKRAAESFVDSTAI